MGLRISQARLDQMLAHVRAVAPEEGCGILVGRGDRVERVITMTNLEHSPVSYLMDPAEQFAAFNLLRETGLDLIGIFHSHPSTQAYPSAKDAKLAFYPEVAYVLISLRDPDHPEVRAFSIRDAVIEETPLVVDP